MFRIMTAARFLLSLLALIQLCRKGIVYFCVHTVCFFKLVINIGVSTIDSFIIFHPDRKLLKILSLASW